MTLLLFLTATAHLFYTPFTKVEESFNLQAMHDILYLRHNISQYDHNEYPGVVPRSFIGPLFVSIISSPFVILFEALDIHKFWTQYVVRMVLAGTITLSWNGLNSVVNKNLGPLVSLWFSILTMSQFHFVFYMSRTLPNIIALPIVLLAVTSWLKGQTKNFIIYSGLAIIIFRSELILFLGILLIQHLYSRRTTVKEVLQVGIPAGAAILLATLVIDSFFWQRILWPEGEVLWYNIVLNKSSNWGTSPFLWYFYSAIPRAMGFSLFFLPMGLYLEPRIRPLVFSALAFVFLYSFLPHKELRFIIYVFPILNIAASCACSRILININKSWWHTCLAFISLGHMFANISLTLFLLVASGTNYPGGVALSRLHRIEANSTNISIHISNLAAQSGVSRFMEIRSDWRYDKTEHLRLTDDNFMNYTHLLVEAKAKLDDDWSFLHVKFDTIESVDCFNNIAIQYRSLMPVRLKKKPCIEIMKRKNFNSKVKIGESLHFKDRVNDLDEDKNRIDHPDKIPKRKSLVSHEKDDKRHQREDDIDSGIDRLHLTHTRGASRIKDKSHENAGVEDKRTIAEKVTVAGHAEEETTKHKRLVHDKEGNKYSLETPQELNNEQFTLKRETKTSTESNDIVPSHKAVTADNEETSNQPTDSIIADQNQSQPSQSLEENTDTDPAKDENSPSQTKEINFSELRNIAIGKLTKSTRAKLREIIEQHYRAKGAAIENDSKEQTYKTSDPKTMSTDKRSRKTVKSIIKQEKIKDMIDNIAKMDLTKVCDLNKMSTKDCLKSVIDKIDENDQNK